LVSFQINAADDRLQIRLFDGNVAQIVAFHGHADQLIGAHLALLRKHGEFGSYVNYRGAYRTREGVDTRPAPPQGRIEPPYPATPSDDLWAAPLETEDFYPHQTFKDGIVSAGLVVLVFILAVAIGAPLEAAANPATTSYTPVPQWFYLPLDQLLVLVPQQLIPLVLVLPNAPRHKPSREELDLSDGYLTRTVALAVNRGSAAELLGVVPDDELVAIFESLSESSHYRLAEEARMLTEEVNLVRAGAKVSKKHDKAATPFHRAIDHPTMTVERIVALTRTYSLINPATTQRQIQALTAQLLAMTTSKAGPTTKAQVNKRARSREATNPPSRAS